MRGHKRLATMILLSTFSPSAFAEKVEKYDKKVIETIIYEADNTLIGMLGVASVIRNRSVQRDLTPREVVSQRLQFSCWNKGARHWRYTQELWDKACQAWEITKSFKIDANLYYADYIKPPKWALSDKVQFVCKIGVHNFLKEGGF